MDVLARAAHLVEAGRPFVLVTVTWRRGPSSGRPGARAVVHPDGRVEGWVGGACAEPTLVAIALEALADGSPRLVVLGMTDDRPDVVEVPMACSSEGAMEVLVEPMLPVPTVHVIGRSPMVETLAALAGDLGWKVSVVEAPPLGRVEAGSFVVVATQGHHDEAALEAALRTPARYIGLVASAKRAATVFEWLRRQGFGDEDLARVRAPAGMDLGPVGHREIAVAILAELVALEAEGIRRGAVEIETPVHAVDPVCGMAVDVATARWTTRWRGDTVFFCARACLEAFESDPSAFSVS